MLRKRKKRALNRDIPHERDTSIIFIGIEGGSEESREAKYFDIFNEKDIKLQFKVIPCKDNRSSPIHVFNHLKKEIQKEPLNDDDEIWVVIDVDRYQEHLPEVARLCVDSGYNLAVSNPCFEYWLLLHFRDPRRQYKSCNDVKKPFSIEMDNEPNNSEGYHAIFYPKFIDAVARAKDRDVDGERWPNTNGSRVFEIVERFIVED
jgi:hypothetical protein